MGIFDKLFYRQIEKAASELMRREGSSMFHGFLKQVGLGQPVIMPDDFESYIDHGYTFNPTVYSIVSRIAQKASTIPFYVYKVKDKKALRLYKSSGGQAWTPMVKVKAMEEVANHPLQKLFDAPNELQSWSEFIEQVVGFKLVTGNSYIHAIGPDAGANKGMINEMWVLPSQIIKIVAGDKQEPIRGYKSVVNYDTPMIPASEVIHMKYWTPEYASGAWLYGLSPLKAARRVISRSNSSYDTSVAMIQNAGVYGMISGDKAPDGEGLTLEQAAKIESRLKEKTTGRNKGTPIVTSANLKWQQMGMSPTDLSMLEGDKIDLRTLCNIYHVPSELFGDANNKTYSNTKEAGRAIYTNAVIPAINQFRDALNSFIYRNTGDNSIFIDYDVSMIPELQADIGLMVQQLAAAWWVTPNEKREMMQWSKNEDAAMDKIWMPMNFMPIDSYTGDVSFDDIGLSEIEKALDIKDYR